MSPVGRVGDRATLGALCHCCNVGEKHEAWRGAEQREQQADQRLELEAAAQVAPADQPLRPPVVRRWQAGEDMVTELDLSATRATSQEVPV